MDMLPICTVGMYIFAMLLSIICTDLCGAIPWKRWSVQVFTTCLTLVTTRSAVCCFHGLGSPWFTSNRWPLQFVPVLWSSQEIFWVRLPSGWFLVIDHDFMVTQWDLMGFTLWWRLTWLAGKSPNWMELSPHQKITHVNGPYFPLPAMFDYRRESMHTFFGSVPVDMWQSNMAGWIIYRP